MRDSFNSIGMALIMLFAAFVVAHCSAVDGRSEARLAAGPAGFEHLAIGCAVVAVCEPGDFDSSFRNLRGKLCAISADYVVIDQSDQKHWLHRDEVISLAAAPE